jgi:DNA topoisomerase-1
MDALDKKKIIIVESPKKAKEISHFLGKEFVVRATIGHFKDLPENEMGVDLNTYEPKFITKSQNHSKNLSEIKQLSANAEEIIIATDPDREGYAIGYFMYRELKDKTKNIKRAEFREITKDHIVQQLKNAIPFEKTNFGLFKAFLGRRIGDRIVGYTLSPIASREIGGKFSVGRVQSPAVRLIVEREKEILNFKPTPYYVLSAILSKSSTKFTATYENPKIEDKKEAEKIYADIKNEKKAIVKKVEKKQVKQSPKPPFTTSTLQQAASSVYRFAPEKTMILAQDLFESGLITYHRTDSVRINEKAIEEIRKLISKEFGKDFLPESPRTYKSKNTQADAHEAIRITNFVNLEGQKRLIQEKQLSEDHFKLLKLIYERTIASQMADAIFDRTVALIDIKNYTFKAVGTVLKFAGFKAIYGDIEEEKKNQEEGEENQNLPPLKDKDILNIEKINLEEKFTKPPARYTEGSLVKKLEDLGIGRPSTYASIIKTIKDRGYIVKEKSGSLKPTESAFKLIEYLDKRYNWIIDYSFTKNMEDFLDEVEENKKSWKEFIKQLYEDTGLKQDYENISKKQSSPQVSEKMLNYAKALAEKHGKSIENIKNDPEKLKEFINTHADTKPTEKQVEYAKSLAQKTGLKLTEKELSDKKLLSQWIDKAKNKLSKANNGKNSKK